MQPQSSLHDAADRLERTATLIGLVPAVLVGAVLLVVVQPVVGLVVAVGLALGWVLWVRARLRGAVDRVTAGLVLGPLSPGSRPRLENLLEGLCVTSGVAPPEVRLVDSPSMNALAVAGREGALVVLTTGLADQLGRLELEGVLANVLGRIKDGSARYTTTVLGLLGATPRAAAMLSSSLGDQRSVLSDLAAVDLTRYPPGLISALAAMAERGTEVPQAPAVSGALWVAPVASTTAGTDPVGEFQPLSLRIAVLSEL